MGKEKKNSSRVTKKVSPRAGKQRDARGFPSCNQQARSGENLQIGGRVTGSRGSLEGGKSSGSGGNLQAENRSGSESKCKDVQQKTKRATSHSQTKLDCVPIWLRQSREIQTESESEENSDSSDGGSADNSSGMDGDEESDLDPVYAMEEELEQKTDGEPTDMEDERIDGLENEPIVPNNLVGQENGPKKRVYRRKTRCLNIVGRGLNDRPTIILNDKNQPIGPESHVASLSSYIGTLARNAQIVPLSLKCWKKLPKKEKDDLWKLIQEKFIIDELAKRWVLATIAYAWNCWKSRLKRKHFKKHTTRSARLKDRPEAIPIIQWKKLVKRWSSKKAELRSEANTKNRMEAKYTHTMGSKSFARVREEEKRKRQSEDEPSEVDMFMLTRKRKDGTLKLDEDTRQLIPMWNYLLDWFILL